MGPSIDDEYDEYEDEEETEGLEPSTAYCAECEGQIHLSEEIFLLRIVQPFLVNGKLEHFDILDEYGNYQYEPLFFDFGCWEETQEAVETIQQDVPPMNDPAGIILCDICESDICQGEAVGLLLFGELHWSKRAPNNNESYAFQNMNEDDKHICLACLNHMDGDRTSPFWPNDIEPVPGVSVCIDGVFERCWRYGNCTCPKQTC